MLISKPCSIMQDLYSRQVYLIRLHSITNESDGFTLRDVVVSLQAVFSHPYSSRRLT